MYKIDIKDALYPTQILLVVYKKFSKTSVFIDRKWPIPCLQNPILINGEMSCLFVAYM